MPHELRAAQGGGHDGTPLEVTVAIEPLAWLVRAVAGEQVAVSVLVRPGQSPETYQPSDLEVSRVMRSSLFFGAGLPVEYGPWFAALRRSGKVKMVDLRHGLELLALPRHHGDHGHSHGHEGEAQAHEGDDHGHRHAHGSEEVAQAETHDHTAERPKADEGGVVSPSQLLLAGGQADPHIWLSPSRLRVMAAEVASVLSVADPRLKQLVQDRVQALDTQLQALDQDLSQLLSQHQGCTFVVVHPAWGYLAHDYGLQQLAMEIEGKTPTDAEVTRLRSIAHDANVRVVFHEPQVSDRGARALAEVIGAELQSLDPLAEDVPANLRAVAGALAAACAPARR